MNNDILLTPHFKLSEFVRSETAERHGIANIPPEEAVENLRRLCEHTLEPLREALGLPIVINSGYRCKQLNSLLAHSSSTSQHIRGEAADFYVAFGLAESADNAERLSHRELLIKAFRQILTDPKIDFDQIILYPTFIHVSYVSREKNRHGILKARSDGKLGYGRCTLSSALQIE